MKAILVFFALMSGFFFSLTLSAQELAQVEDEFCESSYLAWSRFMMSDPAECTLQMYLSSKIDRSWIPKFFNIFKNSEETLEFLKPVIDVATFERANLRENAWLNKCTQQFQLNKRSRL